MIFAGVLWGVGGVILVNQVAGHARELAFLVGTMVAANFAGALVLGVTRSPRVRESVVAVLNATAGLVVLTIASLTGLGQHVAAGLVLMVIYAFFYTRISFVHASLAVLPPLVAFMWFVFRGTDGATLLDLFLAGTSSGVAGMAAYTLEARTREVFHQRRVIEAQQRELALEKEKSDRLLANMLPESVVAFGFGGTAAASGNASGGSAGSAASASGGDSGGPPADQASGCGCRGAGRDDARLAAVAVLAAACAFRARRRASREALNHPTCA